LVIKVLHLGKFCPPFRGGIETVIRELLNLNIRDIEMTSFCFSDKKISKDDDLSSQYISSPISYQYKSQPISIRLFLSIFRKAHSFDIIHLHFPNIQASIILMLLKLFFKKICIIHWHADILNRGLMGLLVSPIVRLSLIMCDKVICTSEEYFLASKALKDFREKIKIIPIGIQDPTKIEYEKKESIAKAQSKFNFHKENINILSVGRLVEYKDYNTIIEAARIVDTRYKFFIVGDGPLFESLTKKINKYNLRDKVILLGSVSDSEISYIFSKSNIFCLASNSRAEAFGVVLIEAMSREIPIISSRIPGSGVNFVSIENETGLSFEVGNYNDLSNKIEMLGKNSTLRKQLGMSGRIRYKNFFSHKAQKKSYEVFYKSLMSEFNK